ncbi:MAG: acyl-CoA dehydrogenase family protein, partial [Myxococcales bacterium]|nr:acyl-CoA dehydrogenase family protein [Myxococcales bacterium]
MDFSDSPAEAAFRAEARAFLDTHAPKEPMEGMFDRHDDEAEFVRRSVAWQRTLYEHGWAAITWPPEVGGRGLGVVERIIWSQELARRG